MIILVVAGVNSSMTIAWEQTTPVNFTLSEKPTYSFATAIDKLYEYDDVLDTAYIDGCKYRRAVPLARATWWPESVVLTEQRVMVQLRGQVRDHARQGVVHIKLDMLPFKDFAADLPHLIHTANSTLLAVSLVNLTTSADYNASRYALRALLVSQDPRAANMTRAMRKSLDDEHTPGVFEIMEILSPLSAAHAAGGFLQFRPVAYTQPLRDVASSTRAHASDFSRASIPERSTLAAFYRDFDPNNLLVEDIYISFGEPGDGFYKHHNFTAWSTTIGYGSPPLEGFSPFVVWLIACGLAPRARAGAGEVHGRGLRGTEYAINDQ